MTKHERFQHQKHSYDVSVTQYTTSKEYLINCYILLK